LRGGISFHKIFLSFFIILIFFTGCEKKDEPGKQKKIKPDAVKDTVKPEVVIKYHYYPVEGLVTLTKLEEEFGEERKRIILALNRLDSRNLETGDSLIVPDTVFNTIMPYSPFPDQITALDSTKKILIFSYPVQAFAGYESGKLVHWGPTSMGKRSTPTPTGLFHTNWRAKVTTSTIDTTWILPWAYNIENFEGISLHQFDLPGYPASHACARLLEEDAKWIYYWAEGWILTPDDSNVVAYGTPVIIDGEYNFKEIPLWKYLVNNPDTTDLNTAFLDSVINQYLPVIRERAIIRDSVVTARKKVINNRFQMPN
jgi:hypothetical protein